MSFSRHLKFAQDLTIPANIDKQKLLRWVAAQVADVILHEKEHQRQYHQYYNPETAVGDEFRLLADMDESERARLESLAEESQGKLNISNFIDNNLTSDENSPSSLSPQEILNEAVTIANSVAGVPSISTAEIMLVNLPENVAGQVVMKQPDGREIQAIRSQRNPNIAVDPDGPKLMIDIYKIMNQFSSSLSNLQPMPANVQTDGMTPDPDNPSELQIQMPENGTDQQSAPASSDSGSWEAAPSVGGGW